MLVQDLPAAREDAALVRGYLWRRRTGSTEETHPPQGRDARKPGTRETPAPYEPPTSRKSGIDSGHSRSNLFGWTEGKALAMSCATTCCRRCGHSGRDRQDSGRVSPSGLPPIIQDRGGTLFAKTDDPPRSFVFCAVTQARVDSPITTCDHQITVVISLHIVIAWTQV